MFREPSQAEENPKPSGAGAAPGAVDEPSKPKRDFRPLKRLWPFLKPYRKHMVGALAALTVAAGTVLGMGQGMRVLVDAGFAAGDPAVLDRALLVLLGVIALLAGATFSRFYLVSWIGERVVADIRKAVYDHVLTLSPGYFETTKTGEILSRLTNDTTLLQVVVGSSASVALRNVLLFVGGLTMLMVTSVKMTGLVALVAPLVVFPIIFFGRKVRRLSRASQDKVAGVGTYVDETLGAIRTVQAYTHEPHDRVGFSDRVESAFGAAVDRVRMRAIMTVIVIVLVFGAVGVILWIGGHDVLAGRLSAGDLSAFVIYAVVVAGSMGAISEVMGDLQAAAGAAERLFELLATEPEIKAPARPVALPSPPVGAVSFDDVTFHYPSRPDFAALEGLSLDVAPGETVALVGPSGAGKTTVFQMLLRFYDPQNGAVRVDGVDVRDADPVDVRARIGLVSQDPVIFSADAMENIRYGRPDASDDEVRAAAEAAHAAEFIDKLPDGYRTFLGERGVRLSGGQRQRVAIARAILRNPRILLLDEATSALDAESERVVQEALEGLMRNRTTLVIAHRLATVQNVDRIVVMEGGRVVGSGRHDALVAEGGLYARLAALQFGAG